MMKNNIKTAVCMIFSLILVLTAAEASAQQGWPSTAVSKDGTSISWEAYGKGGSYTCFRSWEALLSPRQPGCRGFVLPMISENTDQGLRNWILSDMASAPPAVALSALTEMMKLYITGEAARVFEAIKVPLVTVNADLWPVNYEGNRRHMTSFEAIFIKQTDHFLMMSRPMEFNRELDKAVKMILNLR